MGLKKIADIYYIQGYEYIATFKSVDGDLFQLVNTGE